MLGTIDVPVLVCNADGPVFSSGIKQGEYIASQIPYGEFVPFTESGHMLFYEEADKVLQRVTEGSVTIEGKVKGAIGRGFVALIGFGPDDDETVLAPMADKMLNLRVFEDDNGKMNLSLLDVGGSVLSISQFTLYADCRHGRRPSFSGAAKPDTAAQLYDEFNKIIAAKGVDVQTGEFGAEMHVKIFNDGPVTIILDSDVDLAKKK